MGGRKSRKYESVDRQEFLCKDGTEGEQSKELNNTEEIEEDKKESKSQKTIR